MKLGFTRARRRLSVLWFAGAGLIFALVLVQSLTGNFTDRLDAVWGWFLPMILPTLTLMVGIFVSEARDGEAPSRTVDAFFYRLAFWLSVAYLGALLLTLVLEPAGAQEIALDAEEERSVLEALHTSSLWLTPLQSLATAALGVFFLRKPAEKG